jgi:GT2 family glycosyltransferase
VCIVNWNCRELLRDCLQSLRRQARDLCLQVIVVDNASSDGAADVVRVEFPEVQLIRNDHNAGFARGNNQAARAARGRYLFFLNNDTVVPDGALARLLAYAEAHPEVGMFGPRLRGGDGEFQTSYRSRPTLAALLHRNSLVRLTGLFRKSYHHFRREQFDPHHTRRVDTLMGAALFLRRDVFERCGPWDEDFTFGGEDVHFSDRIARHHPLLFVPDIEIIHYGGVSTRQHIGYAWAARATGYAQYLRKSGYSWPALLFYKLVVTLDAPLTLLAKGAQFCARRLRGDTRRAQKSRLACQGAYHFLTRGMGAFWRA